MVAYWLEQLGQDEAWIGVQERCGQREEEEVKREEVLERDRE